MTVEPVFADELRCGESIPGWCGGHFPLDTMNYRLRVEALAADWVVVRCIETGSPYFYDGDLGELHLAALLEQSRYE